MNEEFVFPDSPAFMVVLVTFAICLLAIAGLISVLVFCKLCSKAGYHWALGLLIVVPVVNSFLPFFLAFADWPVQKELRELRQRLGIAPGQGVSGYRQS